MGTRASEGSTRATWSYVACLGSYRVQRVGVEHHLVRRTIAAVSQGGGKISSPRREIVTDSIYYTAVYTINSTIRQTTLSLYDVSLCRRNLAHPTHLSPVSSAVYLVSWISNAAVCETHQLLILLIQLMHDAG